MKINNLDNQIFRSTSAEIKSAEKIMRMANKKFPTYSTVKFWKFNNAQEKFMIVQSLKKASYFFLKNVRDKLLPIKYNGITYEYYKTLMSLIKNFKMANCAELTDMMKLIFASNGKNMLCANINDNGCSFDHTVGLIMKNGKEFPIEKINTTPLSKMKDLIVVDPWLNFVDFAPNAAKRYTGELLQYVLREDVSNMQELPHYNISDLYVDTNIFQYNLMNEKFVKNYCNK